MIELPTDFPCLAENLRIPKQANFDKFKDKVNELGYITRQITKEFKVQYPAKQDEMIVENFKLIKPCRVFSGWSSANKLKAFIENKCKPIDDGNTNLSFFLSDEGVIYYHREGRTSSYIQSVLQNMGTTEKNKYELESMGVHFDYPKPKELIKYLLSLITNENDIVLDSFFGSGTTAHAVMLLNQDDKGKRKFIGVELKKDIARNVAQIRCQCVIKGYKSISGANEGKQIKGLGGGFSYVELSQTLFDAEGQIREEVSYNDLARHIYFSETGEPLPKTTRDNSPMLGIHKEVAIYLLYNGILKDKTVNGGNVLTSRILAELPMYEGKKVIYGTACRLSDKRLRAEQITFKQTPYEIRIS